MTPRVLTLIFTLFAGTAAMGESIELERCFIFPKWDSAKILHLRNHRDCETYENDGKYYCSGPYYSVMDVGFRYFYKIRKSMLFIIADGKGGVLEHEKEVTVKVDQWFQASVLKAKGPRDIKKSISPIKKKIDRFQYLKKDKICS